jgi:uncharacterized membrane protein YGL010W
MAARLREYDEYHTVSGNELCHFVGIPSIIVGTATLLARVLLFGFGTFHVDVAELVSAGVAMFYLVSARWLGAVTTLILLSLVALGRELPFGVGAGLFVFGWAVQFIGHAAFERKSPAFLRNLTHLLVGPAWLVERALARVGESARTSDVRAHGGRAR